ncbi:MAG TPA: hypothetical protein VGJ39_02685 [Vicinamibacterales bacterium]|jgi:hypothetical protein
MNRRLFVLAALVACLAPPLVAAPPSLTPADIEKATGLRGIHLVPETTKGGVPGRRNYADGSGQIVLWFHDFSAEGYARAKAQPAQTFNGIVIEPKLFHAAVAGIGDEAFDSPDGKLQSAVYVRKGQAAFGLIANITTSAGGDKLTITMDQLKALAKIVLSRM